MFLLSFHYCCLFLENNTKVPYSEHPLQHLAFFVFLIKTTLTGIRWYFIEVLIYICLVMSDVECLLSICISSLEKRPIRSSAQFLKSDFCLVLTCISSLSFANTFSHQVGCLFFLLCKRLFLCSPATLFLILSSLRKQI